MNGFRSKTDGFRIAYIFAEPNGRRSQTAYYTPERGWTAEQTESVIRVYTKNYTDEIQFVSAPFSGYRAWPDGERKKEAMQNEGYALWCKAGEHAFDPNDKGRKRMQFTDYSGDAEEDVIAWTCSEHTPGILKRKELPAQTVNQQADAIKADHELYTKYLEWKAGIQQDPPPIILA